MEHISYSQLTQADQCPYSCYLTRMAGVAPRDNAFYNVPMKLDQQ